MGNYLNELCWKIIRANTLLQFIHLVTIEIRFRKSLEQERFKSNFEFRNQIIVSSMKFWKCFAKFKTNYSLKVRKVAKKSDYSLFIIFFFHPLKNRIIHYFRPSLFTIHYFLANFSLFIIKKGHYSLIIIPHPDPPISNDRASLCPLAFKINQYEQTHEILDIYSKTQFTAHTQSRDVYNICDLKVV